jgi:hypothetical protein
MDLWAHLAFVSQRVQQSVAIQHGDSKHYVLTIMPKILYQGKTGVGEHSLHSLSLPGVVVIKGVSFSI